MVNETVTPGPWTKFVHRLISIPKKASCLGHRPCRQHKSIGDAEVSKTLLGGVGNAATTDRQTTRCCRWHHQGSEELLYSMISQANMYICSPGFMV